MNFDIALLKSLAKEVGVTLSDEQLNQFALYYEMLIEKNKVMNLTAITEMKEVIIKHFVDSIMLVKAIDIFSINKVADMGTGAGFPGIPLKIAFPHLEVVLMDSLAKRLSFLNEVIEELSLKSIITLHGRAEDIGRKSEYREQFDLCISRAVANLSTLSEYCLPIVKEKGYFISYKSGEITEELKSAKKAIQLLGGKEEETIFFSLPNTDYERSFIKIIKEKKTPKSFPRKAGLPSKEPLN